MYLIKSTKEENIEVAKEILSHHGIENAEYSGYSDCNGVSVYFNHPNLVNGGKIRISGHGISNPAKMQSYVCLRFDEKEAKSFMTGKEGKEISKQEMNAKILSNYSNLS